MDKIESLYRATLQWKGITAPDEQLQAQLRHACALALQDNPVYADALIAARVYLQFLLRNPKVELPPLEPPLT